MTKNSIFTQDEPFEFLSRKWVKLLRIAFDEAEKYGKDPNQFYVYPMYIDKQPHSEKRTMPTYNFLFYPHERNWMEIGGVDVDHFTVVINAENLQFLWVEIGKM